jgi:Bcr/CflA subfamily drug resistance transporter
MAGLIVSIGQFSMGLVFPSLPWIALDLNVSADNAQKLISYYLLGFGPSQLIYGPISDAIGRRPILLVGLSLALVGLSITIFGSSSFELLTLGRFIQGLGAGCCAVLARASLRDSYNHDDLPQALSWLTIVASFTPIIAPVLGGFINHYLGWFAVFITLFSYITLAFMLLFFLFTETISDKRKIPNFKKILETYAELLKSRYFLSFATIGWLNFSLVIITISMMPFIMQMQIGMSSEKYALWALIPACGLLVGSSLCNRIRPKIGIKKTIFIAPVIHTVSALWLIFSPVTPLAMMIGQFFLTMGNGIALPCAQTQLLIPYQNKAGSAAALSGAGQMTISSLLSILLMSFGINQPWHLGLVIMLFTLIGIISMLSGFSSEP